jgi:CheY-like chemotaxis protein
MNAILIIDDNEDYRTSFREVLELEAYNILEAENGLVGLQMIQQHLPDLILCDVDMPIMNGIEVLKRVKADPVYSQIPFVIITGSDDDQIRKTAHELRAEKHLTKPVAITKFLSTIAQLLSVSTG